MSGEPPGQGHSEDLYVRQMLGELGAKMELMQKTVDSIGRKLDDGHDQLHGRVNEVRAKAVGIRRTADLAARKLEDIAPKVERLERAENIRTGAKAAFITAFSLLGAGIMAVFDRLWP